MRKTVKRSLVAWPAAAAAIITVASAGATHLQFRKKPLAEAIPTRSFVAPVDPAAWQVAARATTPVADWSRIVAGQPFWPVAGDGSEWTIGKPIVAAEQHVDTPEDVLFANALVHLPMPRVPARSEAAVYQRLPIFRVAVMSPSVGPVLDSQIGPFQFDHVRYRTKPSAPVAERSTAIVPFDSMLPGSRVLSRPVTSGGNRFRQGAAITPTAPRIESPGRHFVVKFSAWPVTPALDAQLDALERLLESSRPDGIEADVEGLVWVANVRGELRRLSGAAGLADASMAAVLRELGRLAGDAIERGDMASDREAQIQWLRTGHALRRRAAVWSAVQTIAANGHQSSEAVTDASITRANVAAAVQALQHDLDQTGDVQGWTEYLMLDEISVALDDPRVNRLTLSQTFLSRLHYHSLDADARNFVTRESIQTLARLIRPWAGGVVDYVKLLERIERIESEPTDLASLEIADAIATLSHVDDDNVLSLAKTLTTHYQNANIRLAISQTLVNRMIPAIQPEAVPVRTELLGSQIRGVSMIQGAAAIQLIPSTDRWLLSLRTAGVVNTRSTGSRSGVSVRTRGRNEFDAVKTISIDSSGLVSSPTDVDVRGGASLSGVTSNYDSWPLVGSMVRSIATNKFNDSRGVANQMATKQIQSGVAEKMDDTVEDHAGDAAQKLTDVLLGPLSRMQLRPQVVAMETTDERLVARYRIAGQWQLAAFNPRVRAFNDSLMSAQLHQSAINNMLEQLLPRHQPMSINEVIQRGATMFGRDATLPDDVPDNVMIEFADSRPITIEIEDDRLWITMRVESLQIDAAAPLERFIVRAAYRAQVDGMSVELVRDGHLRISGPHMSMRQRLPIRLVFNKILTDDRPIRLTLPGIETMPGMTGLSITQLELRDGWIGLGIGGRADRVARRASPNESVR